jgi:ssDNA-binding Zn-finger/Zn-ribbon topoisomerase 1
MKRRKNKKGKYFWGCGDYPNCNHIIADRAMNAILSTPTVTPSLTD